jgi:hypothetical protein
VYLTALDSVMLNNDKLNVEIKTDIIKLLKLITNKTIEMLPNDSDIALQLYKSRKNPVKIKAKIVTGKTIMSIVSKYGETPTIC